MEVTLTDLGPIIAAILGPMLAFAVVSMRYQHRDSKATHELIHQTNKETHELIHQTNKETRELIERTNKETHELIHQTNKETREAAARDHAELKAQLVKITDSLADARERLAGIEGHLGIGRWSRQDDETAPDSNAA